MEPQPGPLGPQCAPVLVYDGGCPFCRHFAERSELCSGIAQLQIVDGRADRAMHQRLVAMRVPMRDGAVVLVGEQVLHGAEAIQWLCGQMQPSDALLALLSGLLRSRQRSQRLYPLLLLARRAALTLRGLPLDPGDQPS
ncbi:MAG: DUF393 domain-containing protein [Cyanobacteria bacterium K_DeepCast_35m_m2_023]|nr:DUF393 domain-containing protein [Cyanobacteria bacterium K_DeepCast_35m_m2_023]